MRVSRDGHYRLVSTNMAATAMLKTHRWTLGDYLGTICEVKMFFERRFYARWRYVGSLPLYWLRGGPGGVRDPTTERNIFKINSTR